MVTEEEVTEAQSKLFSTPQELGTWFSESNGSYHNLISSEGKGLKSMIVRYCISCVTCGCHHTLRINVGRNPYQEHNFGCWHCGEPIKIGMKVDYKNLSTQQLPVLNCVPSDEEGVIVNLHPELMVPGDLQGKDFVFPSLHEMSRIRQEDPTFYADIVPTSPSVEEINTGLEKGGCMPPGVAHDWEFAKTVWSLFLRSRYDVCSNFIKREHAKYRFDDPPHPYVVIYAFCARLGGGEQTRFLSV